MNDRQEAILTCVVDHFIDSCQPISSAMVKDQLHIQLSPASVRQVFSVLDQQGYLEKLHTSSGRVPTDKGYRAYVDRLDAPTSISLDQHVDHQTYQQKFRFLFDQFMDRLAKRTPYIVLLKLHAQALNDIAMIQYVPLNSYTGLVVLFHRVGIVSKVTVRFPNDVAGLDHDELVAWVQNHCATGLDEDKLQGAFNKEGADFIRHLYTTVMNAPIAEDQQSVLIRNTRQCLALPDYHSKAEVECLLDIIDRPQQLGDLLDTVVARGTVSVSIGHELNDERLNGTSLIGVPIILDDVKVATLGIMGPKRMDYAGMMDFLSSNQTLAELIQF